MFASLGLWHGLAAIQNVFDILASIGVAPGLLRLASKNLELVAKIVEPHLPKFALVILLADASTIEAAASASFARGAIEGDQSELGFGLSLARFVVYGKCYEERAVVA